MQENTTNKQTISENYVKYLTQIEQHEKLHNVFVRCVKLREQNHKNTQNWRRRNETIISNNLLKCMHLCPKTHTQYHYFVLKTNIFTTQSKLRATQMDPRWPKCTQMVPQRHPHKYQTINWNVLRMFKNTYTLLLFRNINKHIHYQI